MWCFCIAKLNFVINRSTYHYVTSFHQIGSKYRICYFLTEKSTMFHLMSYFKASKYMLQFLMLKKVCLLIYLIFSVCVSFPWHFPVSHCVIHIFLSHLVLKNAKIFTPHPSVSVVLFFVYIIHKYVVDIKSCLCMMTFYMWIFLMDTKRFKIFSHFLSYYFFFVVWYYFFLSLYSENSGILFV